MAETVQTVTVDAATRLFSAVEALRGILDLLCQLPDGKLDMVDSGHLYFLLELPVVEIEQASRDLQLDRA